MLLCHAAGYLLSVVVIVIWRRQIINSGFWVWVGRWDDLARTRWGTMGTTCGALSEEWNCHKFVDYDGVGSQTSYGKLKRDCRRCCHCSVHAHIQWHVLIFCLNYFGLDFSHVSHLHLHDPYPASCTMPLVCAIC